jgi:transposase
MQSYSQDLRDRVLSALDRGERPTAIAQWLEVTRVCVYQVRRREQETGHRTSFPIGGHHRSRIAEMESVLRVWIEQAPGLGLAELSEPLAGQGISIKIGALWHQLNKWNLTFKNKPCTPASKNAKTCSGHDKHGSRSCPRWESKSSSLSTKHGYRRA